MCLLSSIAFVTHSNNSPWIISAFTTWVSRGPSGWVNLYINAHNCNMYLYLLLRWKAKHHISVSVPPSDTFPRAIYTLLVTSSQSRIIELNVRRVTPNNSVNPDPGLNSFWAIPLSSFNISLVSLLLFAVDFLTSSFALAYIRFMRVWSLSLKLGEL